MIFIPDPGARIPDPDFFHPGTKHYVEHRNVFMDALPGMQGFGSGSVSAWIRINLSCWIRIRIQEDKNDPKK